MTAKQSDTIKGSGISREALEGERLANRNSIVHTDIFYPTHPTLLFFSLLHPSPSDAFIKVISTAKINGHADGIDEAFDALDLGNTGNLSRSDVQAFMQSAARHTKLDAQDGNQSVIEATADALIHDASGGGG